MDFIPTKETFLSLMRKCDPYRFHVDFYQREYRWNDSMDHKPVSSLLNDIWLKFKEGFDESMTIEEIPVRVPKCPWYYLSSVLTNTVDGKIYIVDGQQRLTTLTVLVLALLGNQFVDNNIENKLNNLIVSTVDINGNSSFRMALDDRAEILGKLAEHPSKDELDALRQASTSVSITNIIDAYNVALSFFDKRIDSMLVMKAFCVYLEFNLLFVQIDMPKSEDVAMAFEVTNDRGTKLQSYEILKGKMLALIPKDDNKKQIANWDKAIEPLMMLARSDRADEFFECFFQGRYVDEPERDRKKLVKGKYHQAIFADPYDKRIGLEWSHDGENRRRTATTLIDSEIPYYSALFQEMYSITLKLRMEEDNDLLCVWLAGKNKLITNCIQMIIAGVNVNDGLKHEKATLISRKLDKLYTLQKLSGTYNSSAFSPTCKMFAAEISKVRNGKISDLEKTCDDFILSTIQNLRPGTHHESVYDYLLLNQYGYDQLETSFIRYFYARIDHFISKEANQQIVAGYDHLLRGDDFHVEHILTHDDKGANCAMFEDEETFEIQRSLLGAMGLLQGPANISSNNALYNAKLKTYETGSLWFKTLTKNFYVTNPDFEKFNNKYDLGFEHLDTFGPEQIKKRTAILSKLIPLIWK